MTDAERLDWIEAHGSVNLERVRNLISLDPVAFEVFYSATPIGDASYQGATLRDAIDNAMSATETELKKDDNMEEFVLENDEGPSVRFRGEMLAIAGGPENHLGSSTEYALYETEKGKFVCQTTQRNDKESEKDLFSVKVCENEADVKLFFGYNQLARDLYAEACMNYIIDVD